MPSVVLVAAAALALLWGVKRLTGTGDPVAISMPILRQLEGFSSNRYLDGSQYSIGYGSRWEAGMPLTISEPEAAALLESRIRSEYWPPVESRVRGLNLTPSQVAALVSATYNCGPGFMSASWWTDYLNGDLRTARSKFLDWTHSNPEIHAALLKRRKKEWYWFRTGTWNPSASNLTPEQLPL